MKIELSLEESYNRASAGLRKKMEHSIQLLQKAERIAKAYDPDDGFYLAFSGGKDSQALIHIAQLAGVQYKAHFSPTSVDPPAVIRFIRTQYPEVEFGKLDHSIYAQAIKRGILPTQRVRWCCADFKENAGAGKVTLIGIRKAESVRRSKRNEVEMSSKKFSGNLNQFEQWRETKIRGGQKPSVANPEAINNETITGCIVGKDSLLVSPIIYWTEEDVWEFLNKVVNIPHCELYDKGWKRIGCICCPMSGHKQKLKELTLYPHVKENWIKAIMSIRRGGYSKKAISGGTSQLNSYQKNIWGGADMDREHSSHIPILNGGSELPRPNIPFSSCPSPDSVAEDKEREIAENIFDWWISGKGYKKWYAEKFQQLKIDFDY